MNTLFRKVTLLTGIAVIAVMLILNIHPAAAQANVTVTWYVGLGTGLGTDQINVEKKVVQEFNDTVGKQNHVTLQIVLGGSNNLTALESIKTLLASDTPPDIAGPVGVGGSNWLSEQWLDLKPLITQHNYDLSSFQPAMLNLYETLNGGYSAIPFAVYPSVVFYNTALFDKAGLKYPPAQAGSKYTMPDGSQVEWNYDTVARIAKLLTLDKDGNNATSSKFDPTHIVQYGLDLEGADMRLILTDIQPSPFYDPVTNTIKISDDWRSATRWFWNGLWKDHFLATAGLTSTSDLTFESGQVAMNFDPIWIIGGMSGTVGKLKWNIAIMPESLDGKTHVAVDADTFRVFKSTKNPDATFLALSYLLNEAVPELAPIYGAFPARSEDQQAWIDGENKTFPQSVDWKVAINSLQYTNPANLHHESNTPHFDQVQIRFDLLRNQLYDPTAASIDVNQAVDKLQADLQSIVDGTYPTPTPQPTALPATAAPTASS